LGKATFFFTILTFFVVVFASVYVVFKMTTFFQPGYTLLDQAVGLALLIAELFVLSHTIGFLLNMVRSSRLYTTVEDRFFAAYAEPKVTCFICSFNEPKEILEETIASVKAMDYRNKEVILLDDSRDEFRKIAKGLGKKYRLRVIQRKERRGFKAGAINDSLKYAKGKFIAVFDSDQKPVSNFLSDMIPLMEKDEKLALVQTPQYYGNSHENIVANGAEQRQTVFYEYVCEGKSTANAMFCCGSNFVMRKDAIKAAGGFDESTVTEDFATTLKLHIQGWRTMYYNYVYVVGLGPDTLGAYFTQQYRWAHGVSAVLKKVFLAFIKNPFALKFKQWWEYYLSGSYFFTGWSNFIMMLAPMLFLLFGIRPLIADPAAYIAAFVPYFFLSMVLFVYTMRQRGYAYRDIFVGQAIALLTFDVYMVATLGGILGFRTKFGVTPKGTANILPLAITWPQLTMFALSIIAGIVGIYKGISTGNLAVWVNVFWVFYHVTLLSYIFRFNQLFEQSARPEIFGDFG